MKKFIIALAVILCVASNATPSIILHPKSYAATDYIRAILGEAENQGYKGMLAVACGIRNRPEKLQGVQGLFSDRYDKANKEEVILATIAFWESIEPKKCEFIEGADMFCSDIEICKKSWKKIPMVFIIKIGDFSFYRRIKAGKK